VAIKTVDKRKVSVYCKQVRHCCHSVLCCVVHCRLIVFEFEAHKCQGQILPTYTITATHYCAKLKPRSHCVRRRICRHTYGDVVVEHVDFYGSVHTRCASSYVDGRNMPHVALRCRPSLYVDARGRTLPYIHVRASTYGAVIRSVNGL